MRRDWQEWICRWYFYLKAIEYEYEYEYEHEHEYEYELRCVLGIFLAAVSLQLCENRY